MMEKIIEESKQGETLVLEYKPENTKKLFIESYGGRWFPKNVQYCQNPIDYTVLVS